MKGDLENKFSAILAAGLSHEEMILQLAQAILKHAPKKFEGWSDHLRRIADYIDTLPRPVELSSKAIAGLIELELITRGDR